jgi:excisionase family DNA binding protein
MDRDFLTIPQAAEYLATTIRQVRSLILHGDLPYTPLGKRYILSIADLRDLMARKKLT